MDSRKLDFLKAVLGDDGAKALAKAAERGPELEAALLPRAILAWLNIYSRSDFEGRIPGVENTYLQFNKSEERYSGSVAVKDEVYAFEGASLLHLGAAIAVALGADHEHITPPGLRDLDIQRLGKNIDILAKARVAVAELKGRFQKAAMPAGQGKEGPGPAHAPTAPDAPLAPTPPDPTQNSKGPTVGMRPKLPKLTQPKAATEQVQTGPGVKHPKPKSPTLKVTKSQAERECLICGGHQFKALAFSGCLCFRDLAKSVKTTATADGYSLAFGADWDSDSILTLVETLGK